MSRNSHTTGLEIAVVGMAARLPGAENIAQFWQNLCQGKESLTLFDDEALIQSGIDPALLQNPRYVKAKGFLKDSDKFDHTFFDYSAANARVMDPQLRLLHECAWHALENAGYNPYTTDESIGLFVGASYNVPWVNALLGEGESPHELYNLLNFNDLGAFATLLSYKFNLKGPSVSLQTACSTSLVAVHLAVQALLNGECDMALAGGVSLTYPLIDGYLAQEGMIYSPTGHCRTFDATADGTLAGNGVGLVLLKPLENALADRDHILAVIKGSAVNNDGNRKVGYTAPSIKGQMEVIHAAHLVAEVEPESISYIEAHGTATRLGDPVEIAGLVQAFAGQLPAACAVGSVKSNIGHLDVAAGIAGFIKTVLCLKHKTLVPSLHFATANPDIDFDNIPFYVNTEVSPWVAQDYPLRAGVSSFGIGGTNAHVILEAFEPDEPQAAPDQPVLLTVSAHTEGAFQRNVTNLADFLATTPEMNLADAAFTLNHSQRPLPYRVFLVGSSPNELSQHLRHLPAAAVPFSQESGALFSFVPLTSTFCHLMQELYQTNSDYKRLVDESLTSLPPSLGQAARTALLNNDTYTDRISGYVLQLAFARLLLTRGVKLTAISGQGSALVVAACLSGHLTAAEALPFMKSSELTNWQTAINTLPFHDAAAYPLLSPVTGQRINDKNSFLAALNAQPQASPPNSTSYTFHLGVVESGHAFTGQTYYLNVVGTLWQSGVSIEWSQFYAGRAHYRLPLPEYSFEKHYFPVDELFTVRQRPQPGRKPLAEWYYVPQWQRVYQHPFDMSTVKAKTWLLVEKGRAWEGVLKETLQQKGQKVISAKVGRQWAKLSPFTYTVRPEVKADWQMLLASLKQDDHLPYMIVHTLNIPETNLDRGITDPQVLEHRLNEGFFSLIWLAQTLADEPNHEVCLTVLTQELMDVTGAETIDIAAAPVLGPVKILPYEFNQLRCCLIDLHHADLTAHSGITSSLFAEVERFYQEGTKERQLALRHGFAWRQTYQPVTIQEQATPLKEEGVYLITGGLGGIGFSLADYLGRTWKARLALVGRTGLDKIARDDAAALRHTLSELEKAGADLVTFQADVSDPEAMAQVIRSIKHRWGHINGVFHCAGVAEGELTHTRQKESFLPPLAAKVKGSLNLYNLLKAERLDMVVLISSLGNVLYSHKVGQIAYNSANEFLDAFAAYCNKNDGPFTLAINFDDWSEVGMSVRSNRQWQETLGRLKDERVKQFIQNLISVPAITPAEGIQVIKTLLTSRYPRVAVTPFDLETQIRQAVVDSDWLTGLYQLEPGTQEPAAAASVLPLSDSEIRQSLKAIWEEHLRVTLRSYDEDYFDIGGDSFEAISILRSIEKQLKIQVSIHDFFNYSTINTFTDFVAEKLGGQTVQHPILPAPVRDFYPLSPGQNRLFILQQLDPESVSYNLPFFVRVEGKIDQQRVATVFKTLIQQQDLLRTSFALLDDTVVQRIQDQVAFEVALLSANEAGLPQVVAEFIRPFALDQAPLFRVALVQIDENNSLLMSDMHHIIADGMSRDLLMEDFVRLYNGETLKPKAIQFKDYVLWLQSDTMQARREAQKAFWLEQFAEPVQPLQLPTDFKRPPVQSFAGGSVFFDLEAPETDQLRRLAQQEDATLYMVLLSAYYILLAGLSGQEDIVVGTPTMGRRYPGTEQMFGMLVNTITLRNRPEGHKTYKQFLQEIKVNALSVFENQDYPFDELVGELNLERDVSRNPLFDVVFAFQNMGQVQAEIAGLRLTPYRYENHAALFDLLLMGDEEGGRIRFELEYAAKLFCRETVERFVTYFRHILQVIVHNPDALLNEINLLPPKEKHQLIYEYNATAAPYPQTQTIIQLFEAQVQATPDAPALFCDGETVTYAQLNDRANHLAFQLQQRQVGRQTPVALLVEHSPDVVVGMLGILKAGGAYVPIDPTLPEARVRYMIEDCHASVIVSQPQVITALPFINQLDLEIICADTGQSVAQNPEPGNAPDDLVYIIYTSGSTGKPKGCLLTQRGLVNYICWAKKQYVGENVYDFPLYTSVSFDLTVTSIYVPLISGGAVHIYKAVEGENILERIIEDDRVQVIKLTPTHLQLLSLIDCRSTQVKKLIVGGENLKTESAHQAVEAFSGAVEIYNEYGPTETVVGCMIHRYTPADDQHAAVPIGVPIANTQVYILDKALRPVPIGVQGELFISGDGVGKGYLNQPTVTAERFIANPLIPGTCIYRTGDAAAFLPDHTILFLGRLDHQVKIRGYRIELEEIENAILRFQKTWVASHRRPDPGLTFQPPQVRRCISCMISEKHPDVQFDEFGVCSQCREFEKYKQYALDYFGTEEEFIALVNQLRQNKQGEFDCLLLYSGGKDSTYVLYKLIDLGLNVLTFTFDNGFISATAINNIKQTTAALGVEHVTLKADKMNEVFVKSLNSACAACHGCWNAINGLGTRLAHETGINMIVSGLSVGQIFEMRLESLFMMGIYEPEAIEEKLLSFRKRFHSPHNQYARMLDVTLDEAVVEGIQYLDYFRYADVSEEAINRYLAEKGWKKPNDTGLCSSNCRINDVGIYVHLQDRGYHFYEHQLSLDTRLGVLPRNEGLKKVEFNSNIIEIHEILDGIGYFDSQVIRDVVVVAQEDKNGEKQLCAYYETDASVTGDDLRHFLLNELPDYMVPAFYVQMESLPKLKNGKVDRRALDAPVMEQRAEFTAPRNEMEEKLVQIWAEVLDHNHVSVTDNFFDLGGNSLKTIQMISKVRKAFKLQEDLRVIDLFKFPTIASIANFLSQNQAAAEAETGDEHVVTILEETLSLWRSD